MHRDSTSSAQFSERSLPVRRVTPTTALAAASGGAGRLYQTRRGSFMILVVGTLALLAVITILYVGVGRSDRQLAAATIRGDKTESVPERAKDYFAQVIADGAVSMYEPTAFVGGLAADRREFLRKTWDYPSTDWRLQTYITDPTDPRYFTPTGGRTGSTPFLSSNDPTWLNFTEDKANTLADAKTTYKKFDDWYHISNFAPDGSFVNLYNLRDPNGKGFDSTPADMRKNLYLIDSNARAGFQMDFGGRNFNVTAGPYRYASNPADMSMRQARLFRETQFNALTGATVDDPDWLSYSFLDADGDGVYDSRPIELKEWRDVANPQQFTSLLSQDQSYRWVFGVKCIDLSGMVNVNTATDNFYQGSTPAGAPTRELPAGVVPAEVDLMRLLSGHDIADLYFNAANQPASYSDFNQLRDLNNPASDPMADYLNFPGENAYDPATAFTVGRNAYEWIQRTAQEGLTVRGSNNQTIVLPSPINRYNQYLLHAGRPGELSASGTTATYSGSGGFKVADLIELLTYRGINDPQTESRLETTVGYRSWTLADRRLSPLRSNRDLYIEKNFMDNNLIRRHNNVRLQAVADIRHNLTVVSGARDIRPASITPSAGYVPPALSSADSKLDAQAALEAHDQGHFVLPMAPANLQPLLLRGAAEQNIFLGYANALFPQLPAGLRAAAWGTQATAGTQDLRTRMYGYGSKMSPGLAPLVAPTSQHLAPELPIYASAFMAVNMIDAYDTDLNLYVNGPGTWPGIDGVQNTPTVKTVLFSNTFRTELMKDYVGTPAGDEPLTQPDPFEYNTTVPVTDGGRNYPWAHWVEPGHVGQFDLNAGLAANGRLYTGGLTGQPNARPLVPAMNVYGIEAQPFITQMATFTVYMDTPEANGGDPDTQPPDGITGLYPDGVTIHGEWPTDPAWVINSSGANADFLFQGIAFQLSNPFDHDIVLSNGGPSSQFFNADALDYSQYPEIDRERDFYYLEYCGKYYKLCNMMDRVDAAGTYLPGTTGEGVATLSKISIPAGKSVVVYALNRSEKKLAERFRDLGMTVTGSLHDQMRLWINGKFGAEQDVYQVPRFVPSDVADPMSGKVDRRFTTLITHPTVTDSEEISRRVLLWRAQRAQDFAGSSDTHEGARKKSWTIPVGFDGTASAGSTYIWARNARENDILVDRFIAPSNATVPMNRAIPDGAQTVTGAPAGPEPGDDTNTALNANTGITLMLWSTARRPSSPDAAASQPVGILPPWCIEPKSVIGLPSGDWNKGTMNSYSTSPPVKAEIDGSAMGEMSFKRWFDHTVATTALYDMQLKPWNRTLDPIPVNLESKNYYDLASDLMLDNNHFQHSVGSQTVSSIRLADMLKPLCIGPFETPIDGSGGPISQVTATSNWNHLQQCDRRWVPLSQALAAAYVYDPVSLDSNGTGSIPRPSGGVLELYKPFNVRIPGPPAIDVTKHVQVGGHIVLDDFVLFNDSTNGGHNRVFEAAENDYRVGLGIPAAMGILDNFSLATSSLTTLTKSKPGTINLNTATRPVLSTLPLLSPPPQTGLDGTNWAWWTGTTPPAPDGQTDIVATLMAYRDKIPYELRGSAWQLEPLATRQRSFGDGGVPPDAPNINGRDVTSGIQGIQESPGLRSVGELLAARMVADSSGGNVPRDDRSNIDYRGYLNVNNDATATRAGVTSVMYQDIQGTGPGAYVPPEGKNSFSNQLDIANTVLTAATVRSDYFAVYFVVQGYQRSDVENLKPNEAMVPSIRRRYLMIVDRSNVQRVGDKPRILAFKELPIN